MTFWSDKRVLVTGGGGFIGSHVTELLVAQGAVVTVADRLHARQQENLRGVWDHIHFADVDLMAVDRCLEVMKNQDVVLHLAARVAGVRFNNEHPGTMLRDNLRSTLNVLDAAHHVGVERFLMVSSACVYPRDCAIPTPESEGFRDLPEPTNVGYGWAKRTAELLAQTYAQEFGMRIAIARPYNTYGPRDHFESVEAHVIASLVRRLLAERANPLVVWGDGTQSRSFLYVTDLARGLIELIERYPQPDPVNLGGSEEVTIRELAELIVELSGKRVSLRFDPTRPAGQPRRGCDTSKAKRLIGYAAEVQLRQGVEETLRWYEQHIAACEPAG